MTTDYTDTIKSLMAALNSNDLDGVVSFFTNDVFYQIGNAEPVFGPEGIKNFGSSFASKLDRVFHKLKKIWQVEEKVVAFEVDITYSLKNGKMLTLPYLNIVRFKGDRIQKFQAFADVSPLFS